MAAVRTVGRFEIVRELGRGGMAVVHVARQPGLDREVALKELAALHAEDPTFAQRFLREARVAGSLGHPNIVTVYDYFEHEGTPYIAMEYLERGSLRPHVSGLSLAQVAGVLEGVLAGLSHAQRRGIVHRDLKPENLLITSDGAIKIADFGIAKALGQASAAQLTATGMAIGTPTYMAPEQATAEGLGPWTDLYAVGVIAYEILVGRVPFGGGETPPMAVLWKHVHEAPPPPRTIKPDLDPGLADWLERMLAKTPADRYPSATEAWEAFEEVAIGELGPRWRRDARLLEPGEQAETPAPLTPATFLEPVTPDAPPPAEPPASPPVAPQQPPVAAPPPPPPPPAVPPPPPPPTVLPEPSFEFPAPGGGRRVPWLPLGIAGAALAAALAIVGAILLLSGGDEQPQATTTAPTTGQTTTAPPPAAGLAFQRERGAQEAFGGPGDQAMRSISTDGDAAVAGGIDGSSSEGDAALWRFADGEWAREETASLGGSGAQSVNGTAQIGSTVVAVGAARVGGDEDAAVWVSTGGPFERVCNFDSVCGDAFVPGSRDRSQKMFGVAAAEGSELVAVGHDTADKFDAAVWRSSDGVTWRRVPLATPGFGGPNSQEMRGVTAVGGGFVAVGRDFLDAAVWRSPDGERWTRARSNELGGSKGAVMNAVAAAGPGLVAVGYEESRGTKRKAAVWTFDGDRWTNVRSPAFGGTDGQEIRAVAAAGELIVAVGWNLGPGGQDAAVWLSKDGKSWTFLRSDALGGAAAQELNAIAPFEDGFLGAGDSPSSVLSDQDAAVWVGRTA